MRTKSLILVALSLAFAAGVGYWSLNRNVVRNSQITKVRATAVPNKDGSRGEFLKSDSAPDFIKKDWKRFQSALLWAELEAEKVGLELDQNPSAWKHASPEIVGLPKEVREVFAHPSIIWGRDTKSNQWGAVIVLSEKTKKRFVLGHVSDALGSPKFEVSSVSSDLSECLGFGPWHDAPVLPLIDSWKAWESEPITFLRWVGPGQAGLLELQFNPKVGIAKEATNLEGDQDFGDFPFVISRELVSSAEVIGVFPRPKHPTVRDVWFKSKGQVFLTSQEQWNVWSNQVRKSILNKGNSTGLSNEGYPIVQAGPVDTDR